MEKWIWPLSLSVVTYIGLFVVRKITKKALLGIAQKNGVQVLSQITTQNLWPLFLAISLWVGLEAHPNQSELGQAGVWLSRVIAIMVALQIARLAGPFVDFLIKVSIPNGGAQTSHNQTALRLLGFLGRIVFYSCLILAVLGHFGISITPLLTGLGVGGIAVALAVQNVLGDLFASLTIALDKPFLIGDAISVGDHIGVIEAVGLKTTRIRRLSGEELIVPNAWLLSSQIKNFKRMQERRVVLNFGTVYELTPEKIESVPKVVSEVIQRVGLEAGQALTNGTPLLRLERSHFKGFGAFSLDFEAVYWVLDPDYTKFMDLQQSVNLAVFKALSERGIGFAYPTHTVYRK